MNLNLFKHKRLSDAELNIVKLFNYDMRDCECRINDDSTKLYFYRNDRLILNCYIDYDVSRIDIMTTLKIGIQSGYYTYNGYIVELNKFSTMISIMLNLSIFKPKNSSLIDIINELNYNI